MIIIFIFPLIVVLLMVWLITEKKIYGKIIGYLWLSLIGLFILSIIIHLLIDKKTLKKEDYYGQYIINRNYFSGKQSDWQYNNYRFEIRENDSIYFYVSEKEKILKIFRGTTKTTDPSLYMSERLIINMEQPTQHILTSNPTTYRGAWDFNLVFYSPKFNNVCFKKGKWKPIDN